MEIVIIGGIAAGMSAAAKAARTNKEAKVTVIEKEQYVSFGACGLPYYLGNQFEDEQEMFARTPEQMRASGINLLLGHEVTAIDFTSKTLTIIDLETNEHLVKSYDRLMLATGATPIVPPIPGIHSDNVYTVTKPERVMTLKEELVNYQHIVVIGGGFIGIEVADQLALQGKKVTVIESDSVIMGGPFDPEFSEKIMEAVREEGVLIQTQERAQEFVAAQSNVISVKTDKGEYPADAVIVAVGFRPNTKFLDGQLEMLGNGAIVIDEFGETSIKEVYAAGDCATINHRLAGTMYIPLATVANKMGRIVGTNIAVNRDERMAYVGALGSSAIKAGAYEAASTGLTEKQAKSLGLSVKTTCIETNNHSNYYTVQEKITIKLVYDAQTYVLYGAQLFGKNETVLRLTGLATAVHAGLTTKELGFIDYAYAPPFASTWEAINVAANTAK
ncbi:CoA-disulfide reductase [Vagococcus xieshaowenii]|uniref:CoA-disulfide reductase n=1 Tax=Vagococcus xieshaowenii TaxID=2562451 RepID=A0A4Z0D9L5_9ENTE|nr:CoA-disulfide reductase [Vagococcus xieshaowenii]QCA29411.1 CoA-disulfide reductase [Vagococcus xieshaowenii]TFZ41532.1 CoA-disulfide reductase [Vagococcus xieshaowenii]